ncbi:hypothetical protein GIB67_023979 [Kingdonia uniflora]|uniref:Uncharacterized protein n=1 Tax=Kingdonia uniflora TaxID=39325 RepID=A0A7J7LPI0_9MAGN|nr:hypothetical protein GIB67_023979 [Kingdonia uniflora]
MFQCVLKKDSENHPVRENYRYPSQTQLLLSLLVMERLSAECFHRFLLCGSCWLTVMGYEGRRGQ